MGIPSRLHWLSSLQEPGHGDPRGLGLVPLGGARCPFGRHMYQREAQNSCGFYKSQNAWDNHWEVQGGLRKAGENHSVSRVRVPCQVPPCHHVWSSHKPPRETHPLRSTEEGTETRSRCTLARIEQCQDVRPDHAGSEVGIVTNCIIWQLK